MKKKILSALLIMLITGLLAACSQSKEFVIFPPEKGEEVTFKTSNLLYQNSGSTSYSLGGIDSEFTFTDDMLSVKDGEKVKTYKISYDKTTLKIKDFEKQLEKSDKIPDISSFSNFTEYNLCESSSDSPGYRLYVLDDQYWIGTLYKKSVWRVVSLDLNK